MMKTVDESKTISVTNDRYRLKYHVMTPFGWMNDPNGFSYFNGYYHLFYQYNPYSAEWGPMHWGHYRSRDLVHWEQLPIALVPGDPEDANGCYSGCSIGKDGRLYLMYTGHNLLRPDDPYHYREVQNIAYSDDGVHFTKYEDNPVIAMPPEDNTQDFRDPKIWQHDGHYYVILGSRGKDGLGRVLVYRSDDLLHWEYRGPIAKSDGEKTQGHMWECPDFFELDGKDVLLFSPQGIEATEKQYLNLHQTGYFVGDMDYEANRFTHGDFSEIDHGHDFYATQTTQSPDGRRILIGWMDMWESAMPEQEDGWAGALTIPRELTLRDGHVYMNPARELKELRQATVLDESTEVRLERLNLPDPQHVELLVEGELANWQGHRFEVMLKTESGLLISLSYDKDSGELVLNRPDKGDDAKRFGTVKRSDTLKLQIFIDTSSVEFFVNDGETVFTERYFTEQKPTIELKADAELPLHLTAYALG
ncbi:sucrose-6-phosphate hydrolase [Bifidobacterium sp. ESL0764]|uniref:glycoside hydrolase family 32 protein n=1 Tax=Bifidobacterium sp. ESL0764 TaxID=2983228 RepID=UPI0023F8B2A0|nr:sucrose-6-phosphate hydrolase [Bifidobacterium sp. ESL0764]WEV66444.1 sucrose-6-phosphate hydrolase [Bifidobacterium sp. ESL0764]